MKKIIPADPVGWADFGEFIFRQREADPGYYILDYLRKDGYSPQQLKRFCVAWTSFYNLGIAAKASELTGGKFYDYLVAMYPTAKRASERRHFRGAAGLKAITQWRTKWSRPEGLVDFIMRDAIDGDVTPTMGDIRGRCASVAQMGDYFKWKWGDLTEVLYQKPVDFRDWVKHSPKVPVLGAMLISAEEGWGEGQDFSIRETYLQLVAEMRKRKVKSYYAPWRSFDVQDAETICCVYKQYRSGSYHPGIRTAKAFARLYKDGENCKTAEAAIAHLLSEQPQPLFRVPATLAEILNGDRIVRVQALL